jgi:SAM-dependent methyltransferase
MQMTGSSRTQREQLAYATFFLHHPEIYQAFERVVAHAENFHAELSVRKLIPVPSVLSIGSGAGALEARLAREHGTRLAVVEPSRQLLAAFSAKLGSLAADIFPGPFQDYHPRERYDLVLSIHSWYALGMDRGLLERALSCVKAGGKLFVTVMGGASVIRQIGDAAGRDLVTGLCAEQLSEWARKEGFPHAFWMNHRRVPARLLLDPQGELTELGRGFAAFPCVAPWEEAPSTTRRAALEAVRRALDGDELPLPNGCLLFSAPH